jgi:hypothetical protein
VKKNLLTYSLLFILTSILYFSNARIAKANYILIPMDETQKNHLKAYGIAYWVIEKQVSVDWLLNFKGGSFAFTYLTAFANELAIRGVSYEMVNDAQYNQITAQIGQESFNGDIVKLEKAPKVAVYSPKTKLPWDDAVTMVLTYSEIPYTVIYDDEIINNDLHKYDWLHLHHEDFTGQYGKFYSSYRHQAWYQQQQKEYEASAARLGFKKVSQMKLAVVHKIRDFCAGGGFLFAMCSATDTYDIALAAEGIDICDYMFDGDPSDPQANSKLNYSKTFAFQNFKLKMDPYEYEYSTIDNNPPERGLKEENDYFTLFDFSAKWDPIPTMLTQNHSKTIHGFMGQTTGYKKQFIKPDVIVMGECTEINEAKYIHGTYGNGTWTFYGGHDPEDYQHFVGEDPTDLNLHSGSPGFRLILNNILFPAAKKKKQKT